MHETAFGGGAPPGPAAGAYRPTALPQSPDLPIAGFKGLMEAREEEGGEGRPGSFLERLFKPWPRPRPNSVPWCILNLFSHLATIYMGRKWRAAVPLFPGGKLHVSPSNTRSHQEMR